MQRPHPPDNPARYGPGCGQAQVVGVRTLVVGVAADQDAQGGVAGQQAQQLAQFGFGALVEGGGAAGEKDVAQHQLAAGLQGLQGNVQEEGLGGPSPGKGKVLA